MDIALNKGLETLRSTFVPTSTGHSLKSQVGEMASFEPSYVAFAASLMPWVQIRGDLLNFMNHQDHDDGKDRLPSHCVCKSSGSRPGEDSPHTGPGPEAAASLHEELVFHSLATAVNAGVGPVDLWCMPSPDHPFFTRCTREFQVELHTQLARRSWPTHGPCI